MNGSASTKSEHVTEGAAAGRLNVAVAVHFPSELGGEEYGNLSAPLHLMYGSRQQLSVRPRHLFQPA